MQRGGRARAVRVINQPALVGAVPNKAVQREMIDTGICLVQIL